MRRWYFGLPARIIQEGRQPEFFRGQHTDFAVEAAIDAWEPSPGGPATARRTEGSRYDLVARVVAVAGDRWVLDCGLLVHGGGPDAPAVTVAGQWLSGRARLGVSEAAPPDTYFSLGERVSLTRSWYVERVHHRVEPEEMLLHPLLVGVDPVEAGWEELAFTESWHDDEGHADYLLECVLAEDEGP